MDIFTWPNGSSDNRRRVVAFNHLVRIPSQKPFPFCVIYISLHETSHYTYNFTKYLFYAWLIIQKITQHIRRVCIVRSLLYMLLIMFVLKISNEMIIYHKSNVLCEYMRENKKQLHQRYFPFLVLLSVFVLYTVINGDALNISCLSRPHK